MQTIKVGSTQVHIRTGEYFDVLTPVPPISEQSQIAAILNSVDHRLRVNGEYLSKLKVLKQALMGALLTGKISVNVDEHAEVVV